MQLADWRLSGQLRLQELQPLLTLVNPLNTRVVQKGKTTSTCALLDDFAWDVFFHPPYSPRPGFKWFSFVHTLEAVLWVARACGDMKTTVKVWFSGRVADCYNVGIQTLVIWYDKCLKLHGVMEKNNLRSVVKIFFLNFIHLLFLSPNGLYFLDDPGV
jgi:hypothetical protein